MRILGPDPSASPSDTAARLHHDRHMSPSTPAPRRATFSTAPRSERIKLSTIRPPLIILLVSFAVGIGVSALTRYLASSHHVSTTLAGKATWNATAFRLDGIQLAELALAALVVLVIISESCWSSPRHMPSWSSPRDVPPSSSGRP